MKRDRERAPAIIIAIVDTWAFLLPIRELLNTIHYVSERLVDDARKRSLRH